MTTGIPCQGTSGTGRPRSRDLDGGGHRNWTVTVAIWTDHPSVKGHVDCPPAATELPRRGQQICPVEEVDHGLRPSARNMGPRLLVRVLMRVIVATVLLGLAAACSPAPVPTATPSATPAPPASTPPPSVAPAPSSSPQPAAWLPPWAGAATPTAVVTRSVLPFCGVEEGGLRGSIDADVRDCFLAALRAGRAAEFASIHSTTEGDPVATIVRALAGGGLEFLDDSTQDTFGSRAWTRTVCRGFTEVQESGFIGDRCDEAVVIR